MGYRKRAKRKPKVLKPNNMEQNITRVVNGSNAKCENNGFGGYTSATNSKAMEGTQYRKYHNPYGGHGFAAEDVNAQHDRWAGRRLTKSDATTVSMDQTGSSTGRPFRPSTARRHRKR